MFNPFIVNPAYAGSRESVSATLLARSQWLGIEGAPETQTFSVHAPLFNKQMAGGLSFVNDGLGPIQNTAVALTYAYHLKFPDGKLSLALRGGIFNSTLRRGDLNFQDPTDRFRNAGSVSAVTPTFDFGSYYYTKKFYVGLSVTHLGNETLNFNEAQNSGVGSDLQRHFLLGGGYAIELNDNLVFKPSALVKYVQGAPVNIDLNASFLLRKALWLGASFRSGNGVVLITEYNITDYLRIGYSYDIVFNNLRRFNSGTHEVFIGGDFTIGKKKSVSPRYL